MSKIKNYKPFDSIFPKGTDANHWNKKAWKITITDKKQVKPTLEFLEKAFGVTCSRTIPSSEYGAIIRLSPFYLEGTYADRVLTGSKHSFNNNQEDRRIELPVVFDEDGTPSFKDYFPHAENELEKKLLDEIRKIEDNVNKVDDFVSDLLKKREILIEKFEESRKNGAKEKELTEFTN